ncbi:MAG TPA: phosphohydrolase, partial [Acinetobacter johnsonii]|nr:phosphohydrolase [Acinetobacter johnsonii]
MMNIHSVVFYFYIAMALLAGWAVYQAWISQTNTETIHPFKAFVHLLA